MKAYSGDLSRKVVEALERGTNTSKTTRLFGVSLSAVKRYARMAREGLQLKPGKAPDKRQRSTSAAGDSWKSTSRSVQQLLAKRCEFLERDIG
jgi:transposase